ncbi:hypothetical protein ACSBR2_040519 [Camellia fascicularis]
MSCVLLTGSCHHRMTSVATTNTCLTLGGSYTGQRCFRYDYSPRCCWNGNEKRKKSKFTPASMAMGKQFLCRNLSRPNFYLEVLDAARKRFTQEISFQSKDKDISLAKRALYIYVPISWLFYAEDEAFMALSREMDALSLQSERRDASISSDALEWEREMPLAGKSVDDWLTELDTIAEEIKAELVSRDIVILLSVIFIEVCRRLNLTIVGSRVGEDFLIWPQTGSPEELFKVTAGHSLFGVVNGRCVDNPKSKASDLSSNSFFGLDIATN